MNQSDALTAENWKLAALEAVAELPEDVRAGVICSDPSAPVLTVRVAPGPLGGDKGQRPVEVKVARWDTQRDWWQTVAMRQPPGGAAETFLTKIEGAPLERWPLVSVEGETPGNAKGGFPGSTTAANMKQMVQAVILEEMCLGGVGGVRKDGKGGYVRADGTAVVRVDGSPILDCKLPPR